MSTSNNRPQLRNGTKPLVAAEPSIEDYIAQARLVAEKAVPSFISGLRASTVMIDEKCPSIAIDQYWRTYWNPKTTMWMVNTAKAVDAANPCPTCGEKSHHPIAYLAGIWIHEIGHCVFKHKHRFEEQGWTDHGKWNIAADAEMNDDIPGIGKMAARDAASRSENLPQICLPKMVTVNEQEWMLFNMIGSRAFELLSGKSIWEVMQPFRTNPPAGHKNIPSFVFPENVPVDVDEWLTLPEGKIAEIYYEQIPDPKKQPGQGEGEGEGKGEGKGGGKGMGELADHGSGVSGDSRSWEDGKPGDENAEGKGYAPGISPAEAASIRRDVATKIKNASNGRGTMPAGWEVWADTELQVAKIRWQDKLRALARQSINRIRGDKNTTFRRLSRSSIVQSCAVIKPSTYETTPTVCIIMDTSGSMGAGRRSRLERGLSECEAIIKLGKVKAYFLDCDANVYGKAQDVQSVRRAQVHGGGGTDMALGVRMALKQKVKFDLLILLTDGDTPWPNPEDLKGTKIITGIVHEHGINGCPAFMNPVHIDTD